MLTSLYVKMQNRLSALRSDERGASAVEYGLLVALIAAVIVFVVAALGQSVSTGFETVNTEIQP